VKINPRKLAGPWTEGFTLDKHIESSVHIGQGPSGHMRFDTKRTELGELVYQLKYGRRKDAVPIIAGALVEFANGRWGSVFDAVVPAPPSVARVTQPIIQIASAVAKSFERPLKVNAVLKVKQTTQMKNVPVDERAELLGDAIQKGPGEVAGARILLVDDVIESGATLRRVAEVLLKEGRAKSVHALVVTRTK
jgi:competence protein ComFC